MPHLKATVATAGSQIRVMPWVAMLPDPDPLAVSAKRASRAVAPTVGPAAKHPAALFMALKLSSTSGQVSVLPMSLECIY